METIARRTTSTDFEPRSPFLLQHTVARKGLVMEEWKGYDIVQITNKDIDRVIEFLYKFFFKDEPLNICVGLLDEPGSTCEELEKYCSESILSGVSVMAVSPNNDLMGVCVNGVLTREDMELQDLKDEEVADCGNKKFKKILNLLNVVAKESDVFGQYPEVDKVLEIRVLSVDDTYRGRGIAKALLDRTTGLAKEMAFPMVRVDCTSHFSALAVAKLGYHCIYTLQYADHLDENGERVFTPEYPHACVKTYVLPLQ